MFPGTYTESFPSDAQSVMQNGTLPSSSPSDEPSSHSSRPGPQTGPVAPNDDGTIDFPSMVATLAREKWVILLTGIVVVGAIAAYTFTVSPVYEASSMVRIDQQGGGSASVLNTAKVNRTRDLAGEVGVLRNSLDLAHRVATKLQSGKASNDNTQTIPLLYTGDAGDPLLDQEAARRILESVTFTPRRSRNMIEIVAESGDAEAAARIANTYAEAYKRLSREKARASVEAARKFLESQADKQRQKIRRLERQWESFAKNNEIVVQGESGERLASKYRELKARRNELAFELENKKTQLGLLRQQLQQFEPQLAESVIEEQEQSSLRSEIRALEDRIAKIRAEAATYYAANPDLEGDTARIEQHFPELANLIDRAGALEDRKRRLTQELIDEVSQGDAAARGGNAPLERVTKLRGQIAEKELATDQLDSQIEALDSQIGRYEVRLDDIPKQRVQRKQLERKLSKAEAFHETIVSELQKTTVAEEAELGYVEVVQSAFVPVAPVRPNVKQNLLLGLVLGLAFGMGVAFLKEATATQIRGPEEIEKKGYTLLGAVPAMDPEIEDTFDGADFIEVGGRRVNTRLMPAINPWSSVTENYRLIQTNLAHSRENDPNVVFVTSAQPGEGKTTTTLNLALTGALSGQRVLLIDADMRSPTAHDVLDTPQTPGLAELLEKVPTPNQTGPKALRESTTVENGLTDDSYMYRPLVDGLYFIPAGQPRNSPTNMHDSERLRCFIEAAQPHFDRIYIDTPPTHAASDAIVIGAQADATAVVVSESEGDGRALASTMESLRRVKANVAGVVFNRFDERKAKACGRFDYAFYDSENYYEYQNGTASYEPA